MTKLLILITSLAGGGTEKVASEISLNLSSNIKQKVVLLTNNISFSINEPITIMNVNPEIGCFLDIPYILFVSIRKYRLILRDYAPDISISFFALDNFINILSTLGNRNCKTVVSVHTALSMKFQNSLLDKLIKRSIKYLYNRADVVIAVSEGVRQELIHDFNISENRVKVLYNPVDVLKIEVQASEDVCDDEWFNGSVPIIMTVGRLVEQKGQWHLIRAFSKVRQKKECKLVIRGDGELKPYLEKLICDLNLNEDVKFLGWKENPFKYVSKASIFVLPSLWEALPYVLIEAMVCGCPVVATDCKYGVREILKDNEYGILISRMDGIFYNALDPLTAGEEQLAEELIRLLDDNHLRRFYSEMAEKRAQDYNLANSIKQYEEMFGLLKSD